MPVETILELIITERDRLNRAIDALGVPKRRGRPPKNPSAYTTQPVAKRKRRMSAAVKKPNPSE